MGDHEQFKQLVSDSVKEGIHNFLSERSLGCCKEHCTEKCGFSPAEHAQKHQRADRLVESVDTAEQIFKSTFVRAIAIFFIGTIGVGCAFAIYNTAAETLKNLHLIK